MKSFSEMETIPLDEKDVKKINGGVFGLDDILIGLAVGAGVAIINDWDNFKRGLAGGPEIK